MVNKQILKLMEKGVNIPNPESVYMDEEVDIDRISGNGVTLHSGTKLIGARTLIADQVTIGYEAPVTLENTLVGPGGCLHGGYFQDTVLLKDNVFGSGAHVRKGTILEEQANAAHTVGLKQTILFPFVTLGSLINFCDCLMAGGTSRKDHSEVGSSFIHFNYTPNQDKATPSMMGNVHQGVMLNQPPIFMGGQGGLVGPARIGFGCITAAGSIVRKNEERSGRLILGGGLKTGSIPWHRGVYAHPDNILDLNLRYIAGLLGLKAWYLHIRPLFVSDFFSKELLIGLCQNLTICIQERITRLMAFREKLNTSKQLLMGKTTEKLSLSLKTHDRVLSILCNGKLEGVADRVELAPDENGRQCIAAVKHAIARYGKDYVMVIQRLEPEAAAAGSNWLSSIESTIIDYVTT